MTGRERNKVGFNEKKKSREGNKVRRKRCKLRGARNRVGMKENRKEKNLAGRKKNGRKGNKVARKRN